MTSCHQKKRENRTSKIYKKEQKKDDSMLLLRHTVVSNSENPPKISSSKVISRVFSIQVSAYSHNFRIRSLCALHIQNFSNRCRHKYDLPISRFFWISLLAGFAQLCARTQRLVSLPAVTNILKRHSRNLKRSGCCLLLFFWLVKDVFHLCFGNHIFVLFVTLFHTGGLSGG